MKKQPLQHNQLPNLEEETILVSEGFDVNNLDASSLIDNKQKYSKRIKEDEEEEDIDSKNGIYYIFNGSIHHIKCSCISIEREEEVYKFSFVLKEAGNLNKKLQVIQDLILYEENNIIIGNVVYGTDSQYKFLFKSFEDESSELKEENMNHEIHLKKVAVDLKDIDNIVLSIELKK